VLALCHDEAFGAAPGYVNAAITPNRKYLKKNL
jgi:hypothetical protein